MSQTEAMEYVEVLQKLRAWSPDMRCALVEAILETLKPELPVGRPRGVPVERVLGLAAGQGPPPDDETVKQWIHEHRLEKYG